MTIRPMEPSDLEAVVAIHTEAFSGFFLTRMGERFLKIYYELVLEFDSSIALVAHDTESRSVSGFAVGFSNPSRFYAEFSRKRRRMLGVITLAVLRDPTLILQIIRNILRVESQAGHTIDAVELSSIAVGVQGQGMGALLLEAFLDNARSEGLHAVYLTTDAVDNSAVRKFYESRGFLLDGYEDRGGRRMCLYSKPLL